MSAKKGTNNFAAIQKTKMVITKEKIKSAINVINNENNKNFIHLHEFLKEVVLITKLDISTIRKNKQYLDMCIKGYKINISRNNSSLLLEVQSIEENSLILKKENEKLKNQLLALGNALKKSHHSKEHMAAKIDIEKLKNIIKKMTECSSQFMVIGNKIIYEHTKLQEKVIIDDEILQRIFKE